MTKGEVRITGGDAPAAYLEIVHTDDKGNHYFDVPLPDPAAKTIKMAVCSQYGNDADGDGFYHEPDREAGAWLHFSPKGGGKVRSGP
jgi:hypothetical protein